MGSLYVHKKLARAGKFLHFFKKFKIGIRQISVINVLSSFFKNDVQTKKVESEQKKYA